MPTPTAWSTTARCGSRVCTSPNIFYGSYNNHSTRRDRKLLLTRKEITRLAKAADDVGFTIVPLKVFISDKGYAKMLIGICRGKKQYDKRQSIREREDKRNIDRIMKK